MDYLNFRRQAASIRKGLFDQVCISLLAGLLPSEIF